MSTITRSEVFTASDGEPAIRVVVVTQNEFAALVETIDSLYDGDSNPCPSCSCWHSQFDRCRRSRLPNNFAVSSTERRLGGHSTSTGTMIFVHNNSQTKGTR